MREIFESKVDGVLAFGRWLFILCPDAETILNDCYSRWARSLLGADFWRNPATCSSEMGWKLSGFGRVVVSVAMRRAKLFMTSTWHSSFFLSASSTPGSWASRGAAVLNEWGVSDWPVWSGYPKSAEAYRVYVQGAVSRKLLAGWQATIRRHRSSIPYYEFETLPGVALSRLTGAALGCSTHMKVRSWCRLRCGLLRLAHTKGKFLDVRCQDCIFCGLSTRKPLVHCLSLCRHWAQYRGELEVLMGQVAHDGNHNFAIKCLRGDNSLQALVKMVEWAAELDREEFRFWST